jgi:hypothetical protein
MRSRGSDICLRETHLASLNPAAVCLDAAAGPLVNHRERQPGAGPVFMSITSSDSAANSGLRVIVRDQSRFNRKTGLMMATACPRAFAEQGGKRVPAKTQLKMAEIWATIWGLEGR